MRLPSGDHAGEPLFLLLSVSRMSSSPFLLAVWTVHCPGGCSTANAIFVPSGDQEGVHPFSISKLRSPVPSADSRNTPFCGDRLDLTETEALTASTFPSGDHAAA